MLRNRLWVKLTAAFLLVAMVGVVLVALLSNRATTTGFRHFLGQEQWQQAVELQGALAGYYAQQGEWAGAGALLAGATRAPGHGGMWRLLDETGQVVASTGGGGRMMGRMDSAVTLPIAVDGRQVGALVVLGGMGQGQPAAQQFLNDVNRALLWAGLAAIGLALAVAVLLARELTRPLRQLTQATRALAGGNLAQQVTVHSQDELGELAASFNQMAAALTAADTQRRQLLNDVAHELRTPLSLMRGHLEAMLDGVFALTPENLSVVHEETLLLGRLVDELRTLSLAEAKQLPLQRAPVNLVEAAAQAAAAFAPLAEAEGVCLDVALPPDVPVVWADPGRIQQVLGNLLSNGLRHAAQNTAEPARLWLRVTAVAGGVQVRVADNGPGLSAEAQQHVFDRFWRADTARSRDRGGSGLGLAICRGIVLAHDGRIWVESAVGQGAAFTFELPATKNVVTITAVN